MRTFLAILVSWAVAVLPIASANPLVFLSGSPRSAGGAESLQLTNGGAFDAVFDWTGYTYVSAPFTTTGGFTLTRVELELGKQGTAAAGTIRVAIYTNNAGAPGTLVAQTDTLDRTAFASGPAFVSFTNISTALSGATTYRLVAIASALDTDGSNRIYWVQQNDATDHIRSSTDGSSWDDNGTGKLSFKLYGN